MLPTESLAAEPGLQPVPQAYFRGRFVTSCLIGFGSLAVLACHPVDYGMTWDEGFTVEREERLREWFARVAGD